jgi:hypothetical protein
MTVEVHRSVWFPLFHILFFYSRSAGKLITMSPSYVKAYRHYFGGAGTPINFCCVGDSHFGEPVFNM